MSITIYHNPRCSKSRKTLALLKEHGIQPTIIEYLNSPPSVSELKKILALLNFSARDLLRTKETEYQALNLSNSELTESEIITAMHNHPKLIERPIVVKNQKAVIGRPPENVLELILEKGEK